MASEIETTWSHTTVLIETPFGGRGTGFLVGRPAGEDQWKIFLITNKHVLHPEKKERESIESIRLHINLTQGSALVGKVVDYVVRDKGVPVWREHPDSDVDVLAIPAGALFDSIKDLANKFAPEEWFAVAKARTDLDISAGEEIVVVGYPSGIRQGKTNLPLVRQGIISTRIGEELHEEVPIAGGGVQIRKTRAFLIDGATIPGSSGSPVVLKPVIGRRQGNNIMMGSTTPVLLGIVAETRFAPIQVQGGQIPGFAGLGLAFEVETIVETLDLF